MKQDDKHTWIKDEKDVNKHTCKTCKCIRTKEYFQKRYYMNYERSGICFGWNRPDCLDWNDNTLD